MKKLIFYISTLCLNCIPTLLIAQCDDYFPIIPPGNWNITPALGSAYQIYGLNDNPGTTTFGEMLGINANTEWDQIYYNDCSDGDNPYNPLMKNVRSFHLSVKDYSVKVSNCDDVDCTEYEENCTTYNNNLHVCTPAQRGPDGPIVGLCWDGGMDKYKFRYNEWNGDWEFACNAINHCDNPTYCPTDLLTLSAALTVGPINSGNDDDDSLFNHPHKFPMGWWTPKEWGGDPVNLTDVHCNANVYADAFIKTMCLNGNCLVDMLEIGNEPWEYIYTGGTDYEPLYEAISRGMVSAFIENFGPFPIAGPCSCCPLLFKQGMKTILQVRVGIIIWVEESRII